MAPVKGSSQPNRAKKTTDTNAPKRPVSSYVLWLKDNREKLKRELATAKIAQHYAVFASETWKNLPLEERAPFEKLGSEDAARYQKELAEYKSSSEHAEFQQAKVSRAMAARHQKSNGSEQQHDLQEVSSAVLSVVKPLASAPRETSKIEAQAKASEPRLKLEQRTGHLELVKVQAVDQEAPTVTTVAKKRAATVASPAKAKASSGKAKPPPPNPFCTASAAKATAPPLNPFCTASSVAQERPPKRQRVDSDDRLGDDPHEPSTDLPLEHDDLTEPPLIITEEHERRAAMMRSAAAQAARSLHRSPASCKPMPITKPVEVLERPVIVLDPPIFDRWWVKRRSLFAARLHADASDAEIEAEARRRWDLLTDESRRTYDLPMQVATSASHENEEEVVEPGPPGFGRWLGLSGRRRKKVRISAMFVPLYGEDGSWVPYAVRKRAEALSLWGNVSDKRRAKYAKRSQSRM